MLNPQSQAQELTNILVLQSASMLGLHLNIGSASQLFQQKLLAADQTIGGNFDRKYRQKVQEHLRQESLLASEHFASAWTTYRSPCHGKACLT